MPANCAAFSRATHPPASAVPPVSASAATASPSKASCARARALRSALDAAEDQARRAWVLPGDVRAARQSLGADDWEGLAGQVDALAK
jgi:hypothetical protein